MQQPTALDGGGTNSHTKVPTHSSAIVGVNTLRSSGIFRTGFVSSPSPPPLMMSTKLGPTTRYPVAIRPNKVKMEFPPPTKSSSLSSSTTTTHESHSYSSPPDDWSYTSVNRPPGFVTDSSLTPLGPQRNRVPSPSLLTPQQRHNMLMQQASSPAISRYPMTPSSRSVPYGYATSTTTTSPFRFTGTFANGLYPDQPPFPDTINAMRFIHDDEAKSDYVPSTPVYLTSSPVTSPLTIDERATMWLDCESSFTPGLSQSPFGFVPIEASAKKETSFPAVWVSTNSNARNLVSPLNLRDAYDVKKCDENFGDDDDEEYKHEEELMMMMMSTATDHEDHLTELQLGGSTTPSPGTDHSSSPSKFWYKMNKQQQQAPSPALTAETESDMTMDQSSAYSYNSGSFYPKKESLRNHIEVNSSQPAYQKSNMKTSPSMSSLAIACRSNSVSTPVPFPAVTKPSSLAAAAAAGRFNIGRGSNPTSAPWGHSAVAVRPQSAPTLGRPTVSSGHINTMPSKVAKDEDAQQRKSRLKTELCLHYISGRPCPFGQNCTYAHGEDELQMTRLMDLHEAGLVDMNTYRTKPCLTWISTGSCPFGKRCTGIHDHRVATTSVSPSWLPHTETQGNTIATDINVDGLHQKRLHSIIYDNPFGDQFTILPETNPGTANSYGDLFRLVCGDQTKVGWIAGGCIKRGRHVHPIYKLQIALKLRGTESDWMYKYRPQHIVNDELCMVLQKRAFRVTSNDHSAQNGPKNQANRGGPSSSASATSSVVEIAYNDYNPRLPGHILAHEIAFGPDSDPSVRGLALWFNISESDVTVCTPQQAKRFRWKKTTCNTQISKKPMRSERDNCAADAVEDDTDLSLGSTKPSVFDSGAIDSFPMIRPHDEAAFRLTTEMMKHRLAFLKRQYMTGMKDRFDALQKLERQEEWLKDRFESQRRMWTQWAWPVNKGRSKVDRNTPVPSVEGPYVLEKPNDEIRAGCGAQSANKDQGEIGRNVRYVWSSFVETFLYDSRGGMKRSSVKNLKRLAVFEHLAYGQPIDECRVLPHIVKHCSTKKKRLPGGQQDRCWKALLLSTSHLEGNEWDMVRDHFENSRSKKVLTILQQ